MDRAAVVAEELHRDRRGRLDRGDSFGTRGRAGMLAAEFERERRARDDRAELSLGASPSSRVVVTSSRTRSGR